VIGSAMGPLTGFAMNPARDFGPKLMTFFAGWGEIAFTGGRDIPYFLVPVFAPIIGACLGAAAYRGLIARHLPSAAPATLKQLTRLSTANQESLETASLVILPFAPA
jgi:glycerol uptake facilitator protein